MTNTSRTSQIALGVASLALVLSVSAPWWQPQVFDNDLATRQAAILATIQVKQLASHSEPFASQLETLALALPQDKATKDAVAVIAPLAADGVPTFDVLYARFNGTPDQVLVGKLIDKDDESWINWGIHQVAALVRLDTLAGAVSTPSADQIVVHDAQNALKNKDLARAVENLSRLEGSSARVVRSWLGDARNRVALDEAVATLTAQAEARAQGLPWPRLKDNVNAWLASSEDSSTN